MKKIIKALLGGLVLSLVLFALFLSPFLEDDAKWTYQSKFGRVDIVLVGDVSGGQITVQEKELFVSRPQWIRDGRANQGVVVQFPISYLKKSRQITLVPQGKGKKISFEMRFRGEYWRVYDQVKPAWAHFENIRLNGKPIVLEKTVWHNKPFIYRVQNVEIGQKMTLSFDIHKPFFFTDIRWDRLLGLFIACSLLISCSDILRRLVNGFNKKDIVQVIAKGYSSIDIVYRRAFWIVFGVLCLAFGFHTIQFMWGNHDWEFLRFSPHWLYFRGIGRYALAFFRKSFLGGIYLPLVYDIISFIFLAINAILLCIYWKLSKRVIYFVLCGLILTVQPFTLSIMFYVHMLPEVFIGVTFILTALMISEKIAFEKSSPMRRGIFSVLSMVLINLSLAMYPVLINTIAVAFVGRLLIKSFEWDGSWKQFKSYFLPFSFSALNIVLGILSYKLVLTFVFPPSYGYNTRMLSLDQIWERLLTLFKQSFHQLYEYNLPFISQAALWVFLSFTILVALYICLTGNFKQKIVRLILLGGTLYATQTAMMVAHIHIIDERIELFGLVPYETLMAVIVFTNLKKLYNCTIITTAGVIWVSIINDLDCLHVWKLGFDAEKMLWNRVLARLEVQKDFDVTRKYKVVQIGPEIPMRPRYIKQIPKVRTHDMLQFSWNLFPFVAENFYYPADFIRTRLRFERLDDPKYKAQLKHLWEAGTLDKARAWPHENGLIVWKDIILFVTNAKLLEEYKKQLAKEFPRQPQKTP